MFAYNQPVPARSVAANSICLSAAGLRRELSARNLSRIEGVPADGILLPPTPRPAHEQTFGSVPSIVYAPHEDGRSHGNFLDASYRRIVADPAWRARLEKAYTGGRRIARTHDRVGRAELDCANSSDALLMNVFCYPGVLARPALRHLLGLEPNVMTEFGVRLGVPLGAGAQVGTSVDRTERASRDRTERASRDRTEIDLRLGDLLLEAKLTETDFQTAPARLVQRYRDLDEVFDVDDLPRSTTGAFASYQLIRGALAAHAEGIRFAVLCDARRVDLAEQWFEVLRAVRSVALRSRLQLLTWQELAATTPPRLRQFLSAKYGIAAG